MIVEEIPTSGIADFVVGLARKNGIQYVRSGTDELADVITRLSDDDVFTDKTEDLIVELRRAKVIDASTMVSLLGNYLVEKEYVQPVQRF